MTGNYRQQQDALYMALAACVTASRTMTRRGDGHNPWQHADDVVRDTLEDVLHDAREERA